MSAGKWQCVRTDAGYHLRLVGANGEIVLASETYTDKRSIQEAIDVVVSTVRADDAETIAKGEAPTVEEFDMRLNTGGHTPRERFLAECTECSWADAWASRESRASNVGQHRVTTGHSVRQWER